MEKCMKSTSRKEALPFISSNNYKECCGEIYVTKLDLLVVNCVLCDEKFGSFLSFCEHLSLGHFDERYIVEADRFHSAQTQYELQTEEEEEEEADADETNVSVCYESTILSNEDEFLAVDSTTELSSDKEQKYTINAVELKEEQTRNKMKEVLPKVQIRENRIMKTKDVYLNNFEPIAKKKQLLKTNVALPVERKYICDICNGAFTDKSNMLAHKRRHSGEKNHQCYHCPKKFYTRSELKTHMCFHTRERPFICSTCGRGFLTSGAMTGHMRRHTNERLYKCEHCDKRFFDGKQLKDHTVTHTQERKHVCEICSSAFLLHKTLKQHMKIHANKREYVCHICSAAYNQAPSLFLHMKKHGEKLHHSTIDSK